MSGLDTTWCIAQLVGFVALFCGLGAFAEKSDLAFKRKMTLFCLVEAVHFLILGAYSACFGCLLNSLRSFAAARTRCPLVMSVFLVILWSVGLLSVTGFDVRRIASAWNEGFAALAAVFLQEKFRFLPLLGSTVGTVGLFLASGIRLRWMILLCSALWLVHNLIAVSIGPSIMEISFIVMNGITIRKLYRAKREHDRTEQT